MIKKYIGFLYSDDVIEVKSSEDVLAQDYWFGGLSIENGLQQIDDIIMSQADSKEEAIKQLEDFLQLVAWASEKSLWLISKTLLAFLVNISTQTWSRSLKTSQATFETTKRF